MRHTQGPWSSDRYAEIGVIGEVSDADGNSVAQAQPRQALAAGKPDEEREANARLIAAAPDLLEALESALEVVNVAEGMTSCRGDDDWIWGVQKKINEAISKAKGEIK